MKSMCTIVKRVALGWVAVVIALSSLSGMVLCIGHDGHLAIEPAHASGCGDTEQRAHPAAHDELPCFSDQEARCIDITLSSDAVAQWITKVRPYTPLPGGVSLSIAHGERLHTDGREVARGAGANTPPGGPLSLLGVRTTVLRI